MARPRKEIDFTELDRLCELHCTGTETAAFFGINYDTLVARIKEQVNSDGHHFKGFSEYFDLKASKGRITLRKMQWDSALKRGNVQMLIFLGKMYLGQVDRQQVDVNTETVIKVDFFDGAEVGLDDGD